MPDIFHAIITPALSSQQCKEKNHGDQDYNALNYFSIHVS